VNSDLARIVLSIAVILVSLVLHEVAHATVALWCGDDTAKRAGRISLNPARHLDPFGSVVLPLILAASSLGVFGYAKPVPIAPRRMRSPRNHALIVALAGPAMNLLLAMGALVALRIATPDIRFLGWSQMGLGTKVLWLFGLTNVLLAVFNVLPLPPLDGAAILERFIPRPWTAGYLRVRQYAMPVLLLVVLLLPGALGHILDPARRWWVSLL
jgi:Zn-dependent protease